MMTKYKFLVIGRVYEHGFSDPMLCVSDLNTDYEIIIIDLLIIIDIILGEYYRIYNHFLLYNRTRKASA